MLKICLVSYQLCFVKSSKCKQPLQSGVALLCFRILSSLSTQEMKRRNAIVEPKTVAASLV